MSLTNQFVAKSQGGEKPPSKLLLRLEAKLKTHGFEIDLETFRRHYLGYWQRTSGACAWSASLKKGKGCIGSQDRVSDIVKKTSVLSIAKERGLGVDWNDYDIEIVRGSKK